MADNTCDTRANYCCHYGCFTSAVVCGRIATWMRVCRQYGERAPTTKEKATRGVSQRFRRRSTRPLLPGVILGNVQSLRSKMDELHANIKLLTEYRDANLLCLSETWLDDTIDSRHLHVDGFGAPVRADRTEASGMQKGGGLCFFIKERWCNNHTVKRILCTPDIELLSISYRLFYLPRVSLAQYWSCLCICLLAQITP